MSDKVQTLLSDYPPPQILELLSEHFADLVALSEVATRLIPSLDPMTGYLQQLDALSLDQKKRYFQDVILSFMSGNKVDIPMVPEGLEARVFENVATQTLDHMAAVVRAHTERLEKTRSTPVNAG